MMASVRCNGCGEVKNCEPTTDRRWELLQYLLLCEPCMEKHIKEIAEWEKQNKGK
jgi:formylmethanofuran dehydrogenase subunit E